MAVLKFQFTTVRPVAINGLPLFVDFDISVILSLLLREMLCFTLWCTFCGAIVVLQNNFHSCSNAIIKHPILDFLRLS